MAPTDAHGYLLCRVRRRWFIFGDDVRDYLGVPPEPFYDALEWMPERADAWCFPTRDEADRHLAALVAAGELNVGVEPFNGPERLATEEDR